MLFDYIWDDSLSKITRFRVYVNYYRILHFHVVFLNDIIICMFTLAKLLLCVFERSNPVVASQSRFLIYRVERRICASLNLTYF